MFVGSRSFKCEEERIDHMVRYEQVFGTVFERRGTKCRGALMKHHCKVKDSPNGSATKNQKN